MKPTEREIAEGILFTDYYQLTMAQVYYRMGLHEKTVQFDHFFRGYPDYGIHKAGYCISAGLEWLLDWMHNAHFMADDIDYLRAQTTRTGSRVFDDDFLKWLSANGTFDGLTIYAIPEGRVVHPNVPLTVVIGPMIPAQLLETSLLNHLNYQTLIATKAARMERSGRGQVLIDFGLRRGQDKGANAAVRAALIGGADFTSNVGMSRVLGYPPKGTHAHSMVQAFMALGMGELGAFRAYADVYPDDCLLLVDTIDSLNSGIPNAITVFEELRRKGYEPVGIRLDSGDLAYLSIQAAKMLDEAGFPDTIIVLSNNLDEMVIWQIITQIREEAPRWDMDAEHIIKRLSYGVGTRLVTSWGEPALGGVYKLVAVCDNNEWIPAIKISESTDKTPNPGHKLAWRIYDKRGKATADLLSLEDEDPHTMDRISLHHHTDYAKCRALDRAEISEIEPLLVEIMHDGKLVYDLPTIEQMRARREADVERLDPGVRRLINPHIYHVSLTEKLWKVKRDLVATLSESSQ
ncbi:MAG: nicotinate phosphoribosyltransferase [Anaerolineae bacterium]|nr:nicotinate phosphoribosyltransferase [Anaerolineae bacterium]